jgi:hypothetical protein
LQAARPIIRLKLLQNHIGDRLPTTAGISLFFRRRRFRCDVTLGQSTGISPAFPIKKHQRITRLQTQNAHGMIRHSFGQRNALTDSQGLGHIKTGNHHGCYYRAMSAPLISETAFWATCAIELKASLQALAAREVLPRFEHARSVRNLMARCSATLTWRYKMPCLTSWAHCTRRRVQKCLSELQQMRWQDCKGQGFTLDCRSD